MPEMVYRVGELRLTQTLFSFGIGAIVDLPSIAVLVMGLDEWPRDLGSSQRINEERLLRAVRWHLGHQVRELRTPPAHGESGGTSSSFDDEAFRGVPVVPFPRWMLCPQCRLLAPLETGLFELKYDPFRPERTRYVHSNCQKAARPPHVVPARFLVACENGHLDDFPWIEFAHYGPTNCHAQLQLIERGPGGEVSDLYVQCVRCESRRILAHAFGASGRRNLPRCRGRRPHLGDFEDDGCDLQVRPVALGASNVWFPEILSALAIPTGANRLERLIEERWSVLQHVADLSGVTLLRNVGQLAGLVEFTDEQIWAVIQRKRSEEPTEAVPKWTDLRQPEWEVFVNPHSVSNDDDFRLRPVEVPEEYAHVLEKVVLVERLREVRALIGFTRVEPPEDPSEQMETAGQHRMRLSRQNPTWVPATEVRGEGIFLQFTEEHLRSWLERPEVKQRSALFFETHVRWRKLRNRTPVELGFPGMRYVLLHTFAHALMRQITLECGYTAASVRERIYSRDGGDSTVGHEPMAGLLIYTSAPDSEGTLGGLVSLGKKSDLRRLIAAALREAQNCTSDPLCAEHPPSPDGLTLHAAACHACLFSPETSCERGNRYLDRSVLVPTVGQAGLALFQL